MAEKNEGTIQRLRRLGIREDTLPHDAKHIALTNSISIVAVVLSIAYLIPNWLAPLPAILKVAPLILALAYTVPLWLNARGFYGLAIAWVFVIGAASQVGFVFIYGFDAGNQYFFLPIISAILLVFPSRYSTTAFALAGASLVVFVLLLLLGPGINPTVELDSETTRSYFVLSLLMAALMTGAIAFYAHKSAAEAEQQIEQRSKELAIALSQLQESQAQLIESENRARLAQVVSGILHEINTPLGALASSADSLGRTLDRCRQYIDERADTGDRDAKTTLRAIEVGSDLSRIIQDGSNRIAGVVAALKTFVALDEAEQKPLDVRVGVDSALGLLGESIGQRIRVERSYQDPLPDVLCHPAKLNQAFLSVLQNSAQAIEQQGVIQVSVRTHEDRVEIAITDNGRGIPDHLQPQLFEIALRQKGMRVGMRLGLPLTKRNVEEIGGELILDSTEGEGTTVRILLPAMND